MTRGMFRVDAEQTDRVKRLMDTEDLCAGGAETYVVAERVYDKFNAQLVPLLGEPGVRALFARSAKLAQGEISRFAEAVHLESSTALPAYLKALDPAIARPVAETLFATFLALIPTFIGERLTVHALRSAWPNID
jgi:hypothetical protein